MNASLKSNASINWVLEHTLPDPSSLYSKPLLLFPQRAIEFLFPSGLFESRARPQMRPPEMVFPQRKAAEFDESGRPHHFLFYTMSANFYQLMHVSGLRQFGLTNGAMTVENSVPWLTIDDVIIFFN